MSDSETKGGGSGKKTSVEEQALVQDTDDGVPTDESLQRNREKKHLLVTFPEEIWKIIKSSIVGEGAKEMSDLKVTAGTGVDEKGSPVEEQAFILDDDDVGHGVPTDESFHHSTEKVHLLQIFPEEIWKIILEQLDDPNDLQNASHAFSFFRDILLPRRKEFLFQNVWPLLATHMEYDKYLMRVGLTDLCEVQRYAGEMKRILPVDDPMYRDDDDEEELEEDDQPSLPVFQREIFNFRLVSKSWCSAIDHFYQHHPRHFEMGDDPKSQTVITSCWTDFEEKQEYNLRFNGNYTAEKFIQHFERTHPHNVENRRNPLISRKASVFLNLIGLRNLQSASALMRFLVMFGEHIWYLDLHLKTGKSAAERLILTSLQQLLRLVPNLKALKIISPRFKLVKGLKPRAVSFPTLENLQLLSLGNLGSDISKQLISSNPHIKVLGMHYYNGCEKVCPVPLPNLKTLYAWVGYPEDLETIEEPQPIPWKLERLHLDFGNLGEEEEWPEVFRMVERKWGETLTDVQFRMPTEYDYEILMVSNDLLEECHLLRLNLPKVKRFRVALTSYCSLDFILPMKDTLEYLDVDVCFKYRCSKLAFAVERDQEIQFLGYMHRLLDSNIWSIFTKLKRFRIFDQDFFIEPAWSFTRRDWELKMQREEEESEEEDAEEENHNE